MTVKSSGEVCASSALMGFSDVLPTTEAEKLFAQYQARVNYPAVRRCTLPAGERKKARVISTNAYIEANGNTHEHGQAYEVPLFICGHGVHGVCEMFRKIVVDNSHLDSHHENY